MTDVSVTRASDLGGLANPARPLSPIDVGAYDDATLRHFLTLLFRIRFAEEKVGELVERGLAKAPCHLGIGQEAVAVGVSAALNARDRVFGGHRSHSHYLALGGDVYKLLAEVLGKLDGTSRGMGGSMHLYGRELGFYGSVPLVGATIPLAVGAGIAAQMEGQGAVGVCYFGDGATEEGVFHESMNLASAMRLPVLFVCENNLFSSHLDINLRQPSDRIGRYGDAHVVNTRSVDGNDTVAVAKAANELVTHARNGGGPGLLEAVTFRHRGHVGPKEDIDVGVRRRQSDIDAWKRVDPIPRLISALRDANRMTAGEIAQLEQSVRKEIDEAATRAEAAAYPEERALLDLVYIGGASK
ncbi:thiamine pyrophosphate-dependent dehydrogenase E1 component subunit alpha [Peristeroidobacter agariperforans]|uniref:thiamine pyrophosphate-dependent dehydrogenase E1 component subunit alpha n=1 Tax=Peristeroidobacter agariperforans TaxID=268404 RepID=UPI00101DDC82|nr:thiamine pyrophosphate-dependent dehydrogenase E1 component subunit alpha [Peristeroidobacter agariperforans]